MYYLSWTIAMVALHMIVSLNHLSLIKNFALLYTYPYCRVRFYTFQKQEFYQLRLWPMFQNLSSYTFTSRIAEVQSYL